MNKICRTWIKFDILSLWKVVFTSLPARVVTHQRKCAFAAVYAHMICGHFFAYNVCENLQQRPRKFVETVIYAHNFSSQDFLSQINFVTLRSRKEQQVLRGAIGTQRVNYYTRLIILSLYHFYNINQYNFSKVLLLCN